MKARELLDLGAAEIAQRQADLRLLEVVLAESIGEAVSGEYGLQQEEHDAFDGMQTQLLAENRRFEVLSDKQRAWLERVAERLGVDPRTPEERNRNVPRGREVPLKPPKKKEK